MSSKSKESGRTCGQITRFVHLSGGNAYTVVRFNEYPRSNAVEA